MVLWGFIGFFGILISYVGDTNFGLAESFFGG